MTLIFSYGSNMHHGQLYNRCPSARVVGTCELKGWTFAFVGSGVATILRRQPTDVVPGLLIEVNDQDFATLDRYEGSPHLYEHRRVYVNHDGMKFMATAYVHRAARYAAPSYDYFSRVLTGALMNALPTDHIIVAAETACDAFMEIVK